MSKMVRNSFLFKNAGFPIALLLGWISLALIVPTATSADQRMCSYENTRYRFALEAPCAFFERFEDIVESDNGDGVTFFSASGGGEIRVYASMFDIENDASTSLWAAESERLQAMLQDGLTIKRYGKKKSRSDLRVQVVLSASKRADEMFFVEVHHIEPTVVDADVVLSEVVSAFRLRD